MTPSEIIMLILTGIMAFGTLGTMIIMLTNKKQKNEVSFAPECATKTELKEHRAEVNARIGEIRGEILHRLDEQDRISAISRKSIYDKIDQGRTELHRKIDETHKAIDDDIKALPASIITILKNTDAI